MNSNKRGSGKSNRCVIEDGVSPMADDPVNQFDNGCRRIPDVASELASHITDNMTCGKSSSKGKTKPTLMLGF